MSINSITSDKSMENIRNDVATIGRRTPEYRRLGDVNLLIGCLIVLSATVSVVGVLYFGSAWIFFK